VARASSSAQVLAAVFAGGKGVILGTGTGVCIRGVGGGRSAARVVDDGGTGRVPCVGRLVAPGRVLVVGRAGRVGLREWLCRNTVLGSALVALRNTAVRSSHPRV